MSLYMIGKTSENSMIFASDGRSFKSIAGSKHPAQAKISSGNENDRKFDHIHSPYDKYGLVIAGAGIKEVFHTIRNFFFERYETGLRISALNPGHTGRDIAIGWTTNHVEECASILKKRFGKVNTGATEVYACTIGTKRLVPLTVGVEYQGDPAKPNYGTIEWRFNNRFMNNDPFRASGSSQKAFNILAKGRDSDNELNSDFVKGLFAYALYIGEQDQISIGGRKYFAEMSPKNGYHEYSEGDILDIDLLAEEVRVKLGE